jgi:hypothetical protein
MCRRLSLYKPAPTSEWLAEATEAAQTANDPETSQFVAEVAARIDTLSPN